MPAVTERSLIPMGNGGLVITIPKSWARYYNLRAGDKVEVVVNGIMKVKPKRKRGEQPASNA